VNQLAQVNQFAQLARVIAERLPLALALLGLLLAACGNQPGGSGAPSGSGGSGY